MFWFPLGAVAVASVFLAACMIGRAGDALFRIAEKMSELPKIECRLGQIRLELEKIECRLGQTRLELEKIECRLGQIRLELEMVKGRLPGEQQEPGALCHRLGELEMALKSLSRRLGK